MAWETNRSGYDKGGGGLTLLYRETLSVHKHLPSVPDNLKYIQNERQWLLIVNGSARCAFLHCYMACQTTRNDNYIQWNEDLFYLITQETKALKAQGFMVIAMGDFNTRHTILNLIKNKEFFNKNIFMLHFFEILK